MKRSCLTICLILFFLSCKERNSSNEIIIEGQVQNMPEGRIYITEAHNWQTPLYWAECKKGHFIFRIKTDSSFVPFMASIHFADSSVRSNVGGLFFRNYMFGKDSAKHAGNAFYLEKGHTRIEGDNSKSPFLRVFAGRETDLFYKNERVGFGWLGNLDSTKREKRIAFFKAEIKKHPYSFFLLQSIYENKEQYSEEELTRIVSLFDRDVQTSKAGEQIRTYLANRVDPNEPIPNLHLVNQDNQRRPIIDPSSKLTMLIFWASWCGPCRMEIPVLKQIQKEYDGKGLRLVSISIDDKQINWRKALEQDGMQWEQFCVDGNKIEELQQQFNFRAIPLVVFADNRGMEVQRFTGYHKEGGDSYRAVIKKFISEP